MMKLLDSIWAMGRKWRITTGEVYKYETHLKAHGGQQVQGIYYWDTYALWSPDLKKAVGGNYY